MTNIRQIQDWHLSPALSPVYEQLLSSMGTAEFGATVRDSVASSVARVRRLYLFEATGRLETSLQYFFGEPGLCELFPAYLKSYLRLDPINEAYRAAPTCNDIALQRVRPSDIPSATFRRQVFEKAGIVERVSIIQRGPGTWRVISVARHLSDGYFSDRELDTLVGLACFVLPMLSHNRLRPPDPRPLTVLQWEARFANRFGALTPRERQVCGRTAWGMSVKATARDLGIAETSVLTYRQRAYRRLNVTTPFALCALVAH